MNIIMARIWLNSVMGQVLFNNSKFLSAITPAFCFFPISCVYISPARVQKSLYWFIGFVGLSGNTITASFELADNTNAKTL
jgi:hypothetical protein